MYIHNLRLNKVIKGVIKAINFSENGVTKMDIDKFYSICLQGDILNAIEYLRTSSNKTKEISELEKQYEKRFISNNEVYEINSEDSWIRTVVNCYFSYFQAVLTNNSIESAENSLITSLYQLLKLNYNVSIDEIEKQLEGIFKEKGYSFLGGITEPYRGPYIWKNTLKKEFKVEVPDSSEDITVYFLFDFLMLGWIDFATIGRHYPGGWAKKEGLYYVNKEDKPIDFNSSEFQVCFLKHEAQHLSDYKEFPNLNGVNLEYRAKLVELVYHPEQYILIEKFLNQSKDDKELPHPYACYLLIKQLSHLIFEEDYICDKKQWKSIEQGLISKMAYNLLLQNNKQLHELGNKTEGII